MHTISVLMKMWAKNKTFYWSDQLIIYIFVLIQVRHKIINGQVVLLNKHSLATVQTDNNAELGELQPVFTVAHFQGSSQSCNLALIAITYLWWLWHPAVMWSPFETFTDRFWLANSVGKPAGDQKWQSHDIPLSHPMGFAY